MLNKGTILGAILIGAIALTGCSTTEDSNEMTEEAKVVYSDWVNNEHLKYEWKTKGEVEKDTRRKNKCNSDTTREETGELLNKFMDQADYYDKNKFIIDTFAISGNSIHITFTYKNREDVEDYDGYAIKEELEELAEYLKDKYEEENIYIDSVTIQVRDDFSDMLFHIIIY